MRARYSGSSARSSTRHGTAIGLVVSGSSIRMVTLAGLISPVRILSRGSWMTPCRVSPENPAKSMMTCSAVNACSMYGRKPVESTTDAGGMAAAIPVRQRAFAG